MRPTLITVAFLAYALCADAQGFVTYKEAKDPVPVSQESLAAWKTAGKLQAQWGFR